MLLYFAVCESMLLFIFVPILLHMRKQNSPPPENSERMRTNFSSAQVGRTRVSGVDFELPKFSELEQSDLSDSFGRDQPSLQTQNQHKPMYNQSHTSPHSQRPSLQMVAEGREEESVSRLVIVTTEESSKTSGGDEANGELLMSDRSEE